LVAEIVEGLGAYWVPPVAGVCADAAVGIAAKANASMASTRTGLGVIDSFSGAYEVS
jgi:hypothetical protein